MRQPCFTIVEHEPHSREAAEPLLWELQNEAF